MVTEWVNEYGIALAVDATGHEHKGKGKGGGQFVKGSGTGQDKAKLPQPPRFMSIDPDYAEFISEIKDIANNSALLKDKIASLKTNRVRPDVISYVQSLLDHKEGNSNEEKEETTETDIVSRSPSSPIRFGEKQADDARGTRRRNKEKLATGIAPEVFQETLTKNNVKPIGNEHKGPTGIEYDKLEEQGKGVLVAAKESGMFVPPEDLPKLMTDTDNLGGVEHDVYHDLKNGRFYKITVGNPGFGFGGDVHSYLTRLKIANELWPELDYKFHGVTTGDRKKKIPERRKKVLTPRGKSDCLTLTTKNLSQISQMKNLANKVTLKQSGLIYSRFSKHLGGHVLQDPITGKNELWFANKNHASYGIRFKNTHLEFARLVGVD